MIVQWLVLDSNIRDKVALLTTVLGTIRVSCNDGLGNGQRKNALPLRTQYKAKIWHPGQQPYPALALATKCGDVLSDQALIAATDCAKVGSSGVSMAHAAVQWFCAGQNHGVTKARGSTHRWW